MVQEKLKATGDVSKRSERENQKNKLPMKTFVREAHSKIPGGGRVLAKLSYTGSPSKKYCQAHESSIDNIAPRPKLDVFLQYFFQFAQLYRE